MAKGKTKYPLKLLQQRLFIVTKLVKERSKQPEKKRDKNHVPFEVLKERQKKLANIVVRRQKKG